MEEKLTSRQKQALETRQRIKRSAIDLFNEKGFDNVYIEDIAAAAGCSPGNIYHYFKNKEELSMQMTEHVDEEYAKLAVQYRENADMTELDKLLDFVSESLRISSEESVLYASFVYGIKYPESGMLKVTWEREYFRLLRELATGAVGEGSLPADTDVEDLVNRLVTIHRGTLINWRLCGGDFDLVGMGRSIAEDMIRGMQR